MHLKSYFVVNKERGESRNGCFKKTEHVKLSKKQIFLRVRMCAYQGVKNFRFSENLTCFVSLRHPFSDLPFALLLTNSKNLN